MGRAKTIKTVDDALTLLAEVAEAGGATAAELERNLNFSRDKTFRMIRTLKRRGFLKDRGNGLYGLGHQVAVLWASYRDRIDREIDDRQRRKTQTEVEHAKHS